MSLRIEPAYETNQLLSACAICGFYTGGRFSPPMRYKLMDGDEFVGDVCERCAYGTVDLWHVALMSYAARLEMKAALLRDLASRVYDAEPVHEEAAEELMRSNINRQVPGRPGGFLSPRPPTE